MGSIEAGPRPYRTWVRRSARLAVVLLPAWCGAGCAHRDVIDTPVGWYHQLEGGAIAQQRPLPPGVNDPYPKIGTTPAHAPVVASLEMRRTVTDALLRQRNRTTRLDANALLPPPLPPAPRHQAAVPSAGSATLSASQAPPQPRPGGSPATVDPDPELAMPAVQLEPALAGAAVPVQLPGIPGAPPLPPRLPGLRIATLPAAASVPDYDLTQPSGTTIGFMAGTDTLLNGQQGALHALAVQRGSRQILVRGFGDAASTAPQAQADAVQVGALRARSVATALQAEGVPQAAIVLQAEAFGRGASASLLQ